MTPQVKTISNLDFYNNKLYCYIDLSVYKTSQISDELYANKTIDVVLFQIGTNIKKFGTTEDINLHFYYDLTNNVLIIDYIECNTGENKKEQKIDMTDYDYVKIELSYQGLYINDSKSFISNYITNFIYIKTFQYGYYTSDGIYIKCYL